MEAISPFFHSNLVPFASTNEKRTPCSVRHFDKQLVLRRPPLRPLAFLRRSAVDRLNFRPLPPPSCSLSAESPSSPESRVPFSKLGNVTPDSLKRRLLELTPIDVVKVSGVLSVSIAATKWTASSMLNPFFWMYLSWSWVFWPWLVAAAMAVYGLYCLSKHLQGKANIFEQLAVVTASFTWLTLVPPAQVNGYLQGWPFVFFFVYHYFFFFNVSVRRRLYGDYFARPHDPKWDIDPLKWQRLLFCAGVVLGHWLAAFEGPELHRIPGGLANVGVWVLIIGSLLMQYNSTLYLANYSEKVVVPTEVVQFGPYRWVRHPVYASTMLLFATYCVALRAPLSMLFVVAVCVLYYDQKAKLEEAVMIDTFGERYVEYATKVKYKFIPLVY